MRRHYESLNYVDGNPGTEQFRFVRTRGCRDGYIKAARDTFERTLDHDQVVALRDMLNEVLDDWQQSTT
jgi:hypothetical protein